MPFVFSNDLRDDWRRRAVRIGLIEEQYGLSHDQVLAAARAETVGTCYNYSFRHAVTHVAYSPDFVRPHNPANSYDDFGPPMAALESRRRPRRQEQSHELLSPIDDEQFSQSKKKKRTPFVPDSTSPRWDCTMTFVRPRLTFPSLKSVSCMRR